jgi:predicted dehydrogenase
VRVASFGGNDFFTPANAGEPARLGLDPVSGRPAFSVWADPHRLDPFSDGATIADNQVAILQYANGVRATFHTNCASAFPERRFYLCGTRGTLRADVITGQIELRELGYNQPTEIFENPAGGHGGGDEILAQGLRATLLEGAAPHASVDDGIRACLAAFALDRAMDETRVVDLTEDWAQAGIELSPTEA